LRLAQAVKWLWHPQGSHRRGRHRAPWVARSD